MECWEFGGEAFFLHEVLVHAHKEWVRSMYIPVCVCFTIACLVTIISLAIKVHLIVNKLRDRNLVMNPSSERAQNLGNVRVSHQLSGHQSIVVLKEKFDYNQMDARRNYCFLFSAFLQDVPMGARVPHPVAHPASHKGFRTGTLDTIYIVRSFRECVDTEGLSHCDLKPSQFIILVLSA